MKQDTKQNTLNHVKKKLTKKITTKIKKPTFVEIKGKYQPLLQKYNKLVLIEKERVIISDEKKKPILKNSNEWGGHRNCSIPKITFSQEIYSKDYDLNIKDWKDYDIQDSNDWEKIMAILVGNGGLLLQADAGCGKAYVV